MSKTLDYTGLKQEFDVLKSKYDKLPVEKRVMDATDISALERMMKDADSLKRMEQDASNFDPKKIFDAATLNHHMRVYAASMKVPGYRLCPPPRVTWAL